MFQKSIIAGLGLMGTSLALAMRKQELSVRYYGVEASLDHAKRAQEMGAVDRLMEGSLPEADFIALCTPVHAFGSVIKQLAQETPEHCLIIDVGSVKVAAIAEVLKFLPERLHSRYVPCHPIAGAASDGPEAADANLYIDKTVIITPHAACSEEALDRAKVFWKKLGSVTRTLTPQKHDRIYAYVSHLPQLLSSAFMLSYQGEFKAEGLQTFLRIGGSNPQLWQGIFMLNRDSLLLALEEFQMEMRHFPQFSAYGQMQASLASITIDEYRSYAGAGYRDFTSNLPVEIEKALPKNALPLHHTIATFHNILKMGDSERLLTVLKKAQVIHSQCFC